MNSTGDGPSSYAFAGEWRDVSGLDYLRARYYAPWQGRFITKDVWPGDYARPLTLNQWNYVVSNPVNLTDPTGMFPDYCRGFQLRLDYENCVRKFYNLSAPRYHSIIPFEQQIGRPGCWSGPVAYTAPGYVEGNSTAVLLGAVVTFTPAQEIVYDFARMERQRFVAMAFGSASAAGIGITGIQYHGTIFKFENVTSITESYKGPFAYGSIAVGSTFNVSVGVQGFKSLSNDVWGLSEFFGYTLGHTESAFGVFTLEVGMGVASPAGPILDNYASNGTKVNVSKLIADILKGSASPSVIPDPFVYGMRGIGSVIAHHYAWVHDEIYVNSK